MSQILYLLDLRSLRNRAMTGVRQVSCLGEKCHEELTFSIIQVQVWSLQRAETSIGKWMDMWVEGHREKCAGSGFLGSSL